MSTYAYSESSLGSYQDLDVAVPPSYLTPIPEAEEEIDQARNSKETGKNVRYLSKISIIFGARKSSQENNRSQSHLIQGIYF